MDFLTIVRARHEGVADAHQDPLPRQRERLLHLVRHANRASRFYHDLYASEDVSGGGFRLEDLPTVDKATLMQRWDDVVTVPELKRDALRAFVDADQEGRLYLDRFVAVQTSGTTGVPGLFVYSRKEWDQTVGLTIARFPVRPPLVRIHRVAWMGMIGPHYGGWRLFRSMPRPFTHLIPIPATLPMHEQVRRLQKGRPQILAGYVSAIHLAAQEQLAGTLCIHPETVVTSGEPLFPRAAQDIVRAWGVQPLDIYSACEALILAVACREGKLHVNEDWFILEAPQDEAGPVLLTNLCNHTMPLIRYQLGDVARMSGAPCPCGSPFRSIERLEGRSDDILWFERPAGGREPLVPQMFAESFAPALKRWQVVQEGPDSLRFRGIVGGADRDETATIIRQHLGRVLADKALENVRVTVELVDALPLDPVSGKHHQVVRAPQVASLECAQSSSTGSLLLQPPARSTP